MGARGLAGRCVAVLMLALVAVPVHSQALYETASGSVLAKHAGGCVLMSIVATRLDAAGTLGANRLSVALFQDPARADCATGPALEPLAHGESATFDLTIERGLGEAVLSATVPLVFRTGETRALALKARWIAVAGPPLPDRQASPLTPPRHGYQRGARLQASLTEAGSDWIATPFLSEGSLHAGVLVPK
jgi:hypothetical protein